MDRDRLEKIFASLAAAGGKNARKEAMEPSRDNELEVLQRFEGYLRFVREDHCEWDIDVEDQAMIASSLLKAEVQLDIRDAIVDGQYDIEIEAPEISELIRKTIAEHESRVDSVDTLVDRAYPKLPDLPKRYQGPFDLGPK